MKYLVALLLWINIAYAQPIEFVVSASPGGPADTASRRIADKIRDSSNIKMTVVNRSGAAHTIAYNYMASAKTPVMLIATSEINSHDVINYVEDLYTLGHFDMVLFASSKSSLYNLNDLINLSKSREINFGAPGVKGSFSYAVMDSLCSTQLRCLRVPYKSGAEGMLAIMIGDIDVYALPSIGISQFLENDKLRIIHTIKNKDAWFKIFVKNLSQNDKQTILKILKDQDIKFYTDLGFQK